MAQRQEQIVRTYHGSPREVDASARYAKQRAESASVDTERAYRAARRVLESEMCTDAHVDAELDAIDEALETATGQAA